MLRIIGRASTLTAFVLLSIPAAAADRIENSPTACCIARTCLCVADSAGPVTAYSADTASSGPAAYKSDVATTTDLRMQQAESDVAAVPDGSSVRETPRVRNTPQPTPGGSPIPGPGIGPIPTPFFADRPDRPHPLKGKVLPGLPGNPEPESPPIPNPGNGPLPNPLSIERPDRMPTPMMEFDRPAPPHPMKDRELPVRPPLPRGHHSDR